ncbi:MAG: biotin--[acetyl-CoA-carboxylase] ligase [Parvularculaceae bacterium]|nr:biotin--[acetyl-CoA-carboxylase] ligase [Parvularculaceae bacterium]
MKLPSGARSEVFDTLDSTSEESKRRILTGETGPLWLVAKEQTAGYGRRGTPWRQAVGDLAATYLFSPNAGQERMPQISFVAGLAVADALARFAPDSAFKLKWPNDIIVNGAKIAGLLLELSFTRDNQAIVSFGVGVNIVNAPSGMDYPTARMLDLCGRAPTTDEVLGRIDELFAYWLSIWRHEGFSPVRSAWLLKAQGIGAKIRVRLAGNEFEGVFRDLDGEGALILDIDGEAKRVTAGTIIG